MIETSIENPPSVGWLVGCGDGGEINVNLLTSRRSEFCWSKTEFWVGIFLFLIFFFIDLRPLYPLKWALNTIPSFFMGHPVNVQLYQDFQNPVCWGPSWPTLIGHSAPSQPTVLPHLSLVCPSFHPLSCEASSDLEPSLNPVFSVWPGLEPPPPSSLIKEMLAISYYRSFLTFC